jgi:hypothetical protein
VVHATGILHFILRQLTQSDPWLILLENLSWRLQHINLHIVPADVTDREACFAEPLAAACRIREQQVHSVCAVRRSGFFG